MRRYAVWMGGSGHPFSVLPCTEVTDWLHFITDNVTVPDLPRASCMEVYSNEAGVINLWFNADQDQFAPNVHASWMRVGFDVQQYPADDTEESAMQFLRGLAIAQAINGPVLLLQATPELENYGLTRKTTTALAGLVLGFDELWHKIRHTMEGTDGA